MKKYLLYLFLMLAALPVSMHADNIPISEFDGEDVLQIYGGTYVQRSAYDISMRGKFRVSGSTVFLDGFYGFSIPMKYIQSGGRTYLEFPHGSTDYYGTYNDMACYMDMRAAYWVAGDHNYQYDGTTDGSALYIPNKPYNGYNAYVYTNYPASHVGSRIEVVRNATGHLSLKGSTPLHIRIFNRSNDNIEFETVYNTQEMMTFTPNAYEIDDDDTANPVPLQILSNDTNFQIANFCDLGLAFENKVSGGGIVKNLKLYIDGYATWNGRKLTIPSQIMSSWVEQYWEGLKTYSLARVTEGGYTYNINYSGYWTATTPRLTVDDMYICGLNGNTMKDITGQFEVLSVSHTKGANNYWVNCGGKLTTHTDRLDLTFRDIYLYDLSGRTVAGKTDKAVLASVPMEIDITHQVALKNNSVTGNKRDGITVNATISGIDYKDYVKDYDLYIIPGVVNAIFMQETDDETGLKGAKLIKSGISVANQTLSVNIPRTLEGFDALAEAIADKNGASIFLKANYTNEYPLHSSFHSLSSVVSNVEVGVKPPLFTVYLDGSTTPATVEPFKFDTQADIRIAAQQTGCVIYYVFGDDEDPADGSSYTSPIIRTQTTKVRAVVYDPVTDEYSPEASVLVIRNVGKPVLSYNRRGIDPEGTWIEGFPSYVKVNNTRPEPLFFHNPLAAPDLVGDPKGVDLKFDVDAGYDIYYAVETSFLNYNVEPTFPAVADATTKYTGPIYCDYDSRYTVVAVKDGSVSDPFYLYTSVAPEVRYYVDSDILPQTGYHYDGERVYFNEYAEVYIEPVADRIETRYIYYNIDKDVNGSSSSRIQYKSAIPVDHDLYIKAYGRRYLFGNNFKSRIDLTNYPIDTEGRRYTPTNEVLTRQENQVSGGVGLGYIICAVTDGNRVHALSEYNCMSHGIVSVDANFKGDGHAYRKDDSRIQEFYIGGNEITGFYFWTGLNSQRKVLSTDPATNNLYLESKEEAEAAGHVYMCDIKTDQYRNPELRRIITLDGSCSVDDLYNAYITFHGTGNNTLNMFKSSVGHSFEKGLDHVFAAGDNSKIGSLKPLEVHLFSSDDWETTGVDNVGNEIDIFIRVEGNEVVIGGTDQEAFICDMLGREVYRGTDRRIRLANGFYVVTVANTAARVAIK